MSSDLKLNGIGKELNTLLAERLSKEGIPSCFGNMSPPFIKNTVQIKEEEFFKVRFNILEEDKIEDFDLSKLVDLKEYIGSKKFALDKAGKNRIEDMKAEIINNYVEHVCNCIKCKYQESCYRITTCYLLSININTK